MIYESTLGDGTPIVFRRVRPDDKDMLVEGFRALSDQSRYERFFVHLEKLTEKQLRYLTEVDHENHSAWAALVEEDDRWRGVGVGRWVRLKDEPGVAEIAVTVIDEYQRKGIGRMLIYVIALGAKEKGIEALRAWVLGDNRATLKMLEQIGAKRGIWEHGVYEVTIPVRDLFVGSPHLPMELKARAEE